MDFQLVQKGRLKWFACPALSQFPQLVHAFTSRAGLSVGHTETDFQRNSRSYLQALEVDDFKLAFLRQIHSAIVWRVARGSGEADLAYVPCGVPQSKAWKPTEPIGDGLITNERKILLSVRTADCMPILVADLRRHAVAAIHAGWRGALARIIEKTVGEMRRTFRSNPTDLIAAIGPSIRACCYEVGEEVVDLFRGRFVNGESFFRTDASGDSRRYEEKIPWLIKEPSGHRSPNHSHLDLVEVALDQLKQAGVRRSQIHIAPLCTACRSDLFFSYRRQGGQAGRMMALIGFRS